MCDPVKPTPWLVCLSLFVASCVQHDPPPQKPIVPVIVIPPIPSGSPYEEAYTARQTPADASTHDRSVDSIEEMFQCTYHIIGDSREFPTPLLAILEALKMGLTEHVIEISCYREASIDPVLP